MTLQAVQIRDAQTWDETLLALPNPHVLQSWTWGEIKARHGWQATRLAFRQEGRVVAAASVLRRRPGRLPVSILYVPKGPAVDWTDGGRVQAVLTELERFARRQRALFIKIDPDVYYREDCPAFSPRPPSAAETAEGLGSRGWILSAEQVQFRNTLLLDLGRPEEDLLAAMHSKFRYNIRLAARKGVTVRDGSAADAGLLYRIYAETAARDGFIIRPQAYYQEVWSSFLEGVAPNARRGGARLLLADVEGEVVAGLVLLTFGPTAWYMYGASSDRHRDKMPNHLLQWEAVRRARESGCRLYDLWGAGDRLDDADAMAGVVRFKLGMGGQIARGLGAWDYAPARAPYWLYTAAMPGVLSWMRGRHRAMEAPG